MILASNILCMSLYGMQRHDMDQYDEGLLVGFMGLALEMIASHQILRMNPVEWILEIIELLALSSPWTQ